MRASFDKDFRDEKLAQPNTAIILVKVEGPRGTYVATLQQSLPCEEADRLVAFLIHLCANRHPAAKAFRLAWGWALRRPSKKKKKP